METSILAEAVLSPGIKLAPQTQTIWPTLAQFLGKVYDRHLASDEAKRVLFEPHRVMTPDDFYSTKCAGAGLYALLEQARHTATTGTNLPTEVTGCTVSYRVLEHGVPIYFVDEEFARAVAATQLPDDFTFDDLHWPQEGMVIAWPPGFMSEYTGRDLCYVYAAHCPAGRFWPKGLAQAPVIEVPEGRGKVGWFYYASTGASVECFVSAYLTRDELGQAIAGYTYTDYMGAEPLKVRADQELTERVSALMIKLLVILYMQPALIAPGAQERPQRVKHGKVVQRELWGANFIGRGYRMARQQNGTHNSPRMHIRRGHVTWQVTGPRAAAAFISTKVLPRNDQGGIDWAQVAPEVREQFHRCHKRLWLEPVLIGGKE